jgi:hypothetical protein
VGAAPTHQHSDALLGIFDAIAPAASAALASLAAGDEARFHAGNILGMDIKGHIVKCLWVEHASDIAEEYYASFTLDRAAKKHLLMLSAEGGVEIEEVAEKNPDAIVKLHIDPVDGLSEAVCRDWVVAANLNPSVTDGAVALDLEAVRLLVGAVGPLQVPGIDEPVTGENAIQWMKAAWEAPVGSDTGPETGRFHDFSIRG